MWALPNRLHEHILVLVTFDQYSITVFCWSSQRTWNRKCHNLSSLSWPHDEMGWACHWTQLLFVVRPMISHDSDHKDDPSTVHTRIKWQPRQGVLEPMTTCTEIGWAAVGTRIDCSLCCQVVIDCLNCHLDYSNFSSSSNLATKTAIHRTFVVPTLFANILQPMDKLLRAVHIDGFARSQHLRYVIYSCQMTSNWPIKIRKMIWNSEQ